MKIYRPFLYFLLTIASLGAVSFVHATSGDSAAFSVDTRNYTESVEHIVHTDNRAYIEADTFPGSLRQAIANADPGATVDFAAPLADGIITLGGSELVITEDLTVDGSALPSPVAIDGGGSSRVLQVTSTVTLKSVIIQNGEGPDQGGGIFNNGGTLALEDVELRSNKVTAGTGRGGGIYSSNSSITDIRRSTFSLNLSADLGGGIYNNGGNLTVVNSTIEGNVAADRGGGIFNRHGGTITINHATISGNTATTVAGGGLFNAGTVNLDNSIIAGNSAPSAANSAGMGTFSGTDNLTSGNPELAPLADYGGRTPTMALRAGSPAINAAGTSALAIDQRGLLRPVGGSPDIGAYESGNVAGYAAWAAEMIPAGRDASFAGDAEDDDSSNGSEYALGTGVLISDPDSPNNPAMVTNGSGGIEITFGLNLDAALDTKWIIKRSTDLVNFTEIYNYDGAMASSNPVAGVSAVVGAGNITVTDENPPVPRAFYKFEAEKYGY